MRGRRYPMLANQWDKLVGRDQECDCIDKSKQSQNDKPCQPIGISLRKEFLENAFVLSHSEILLISTRTDVQRSRLMKHPKPPLAKLRALTLQVMRFSFPAFTPG